MAEVREVVIEVDVQAGESAQKLAEVKRNISALKDEQKQLQQFIKAGADTTGELSARYAENAASLKQLTAEEKMYTAQLNAATQGERKYGDSLVEMSAQLAQLKQEYRGLSAAQRESAGGQQLLKTIQEMDKALKDADANMGDHQRNVGNYASALLGLNGNTLKVVTLFQGGFKQALSAAGAAIKSFGKALLLNPVILAVVAAIALATKTLEKLKEAFAGNDDASTALQKAMASLQPIINAVGKAFSVLAEGVAAVVQGFMSAVTWVAKLIPSYREAAKAAEELVTAQDMLEDKEREYVVASAERQKQIAELKKQERSDEKLTADEREALLQQVDDLEKQDLEERRSLAQERLRQREEELSRKRKLNDDEKNELARLRADLIKTETDYITATTRIAQRASNARKEREAAEAAAAEKARQAWRQAQQQRLQALKEEETEMRKLQDLRLQFETDEYQRQRKQTELNYNRQIEDIKKRLEADKKAGKMTAETKKALDQQIIALEALKLQELARLDKEHNDLMRQQDEEQEQWVDEQFKAAMKRVDEAYKEYQQKLAGAFTEQTDRYANDIQAKLNAVFGNAKEAADIELEAMTSYYQRLLGMDKETKNAMFATETEYKAAVLKAEADMLAARQASEEAMQQQIETTASTMHSLTSALGDLYEAASDDAESYERFRKAIAIVDAVISMAQAIAAATSTSTAGDPYTMAIRIAANVAAVTAQFAAVIKAIKAAQVPSAGSYATGGIVPGNATTGDRMTANVNSREMILTMADQRRLLALIRAGVPAYEQDYSAMAAVMREALAGMPAPVLDYTEFIAYSDRRRQTAELVRIK